MQVFVAGATGFVGRVLVSRLALEGHEVVVWARNPERAINLLGEGVRVVPANAPREVLKDVMERSDAVVNLAGEPIMGGRWTAVRRQAVVDSRVRLTRELVETISAASRRPHVLVSSSAVGFYGDGGDRLLTEDGPPGSGFLARLCVDWEAAALSAFELGVRTVLLRTGVVLGPDGGALAKLLPLFRLGLGGRVGSGRQYMPWIHLCDMIDIITQSIHDARFRGPINVTAPECVTNALFARTLGRVLRRPAVVPVPGMALRLLYGDAACVLLDGQRVEARKLAELDFSYRFPGLEQALSVAVSGRGCEAPS